MSGGCRDSWFEVPLPFFLRNAEVGLNWSRPLTGTFLGVFIIVYGQIQSWCPQLVLGPLRQAPANKYVAVLWAGILLFVPLGLGPTILTSSPFQEHDTGAMSAIMIVRSHHCSSCLCCARCGAAAALGRAEGLGVHCDFGPCIALTCSLHLFGSACSLKSVLFSSLSRTTVRRGAETAWHAARMLDI